VQSVKPAKLIRSLLPWFIAALLLFFLFRRYPARDVLEAATLVNPLLFVPFLLIYFVYVNLADSWSLNRILRLFGIPSHGKTVLEIKLASNLAMVLNYGVGQGTLAYLLKNQYKVPFATTSSVLVFIILIDIYWMISIACLGTLITDIAIAKNDIDSIIRLLWLLSTSGLLALIAFWRFAPWENRIDWPLAKNLLHTFHTATPVDYLTIMAWRLPLHLATSTYLYFLALCFGAYFPLSIVVTLLPLTIIIGAIPITPSGLGTVQLAMIYFFGSLVVSDVVTKGSIDSQELIFAMSILFTAGIYILKLVTGAVFFRKTLNQSG
jgi:uncharacterized membrane protein YbhN (UPF0104 family)